MAYSSTITVTQKATGNPAIDANGPIYLVTITETEAAQTSEVEIVLSDEGLPAVLRIHSRTCILSAGTGSTIDPILGTVTDPASASAWKFENDTAAASVHEQPITPIKYAEAATSLFHRSVPDNAAADHTITTTYVMSAGIEPIV